MKFNEFYKLFVEKLSDFSYKNLNAKDYANGLLYHWQINDLEFVMNTYYKGDDIATDALWLKCYKDKARFFEDLGDIDTIYEAIINLVSNHNESKV